jgi:tRNA A-37 threonylcarbamoyl transferase component Bud32
MRQRRLRWWLDGEPTPRLQALMSAPDQVLRSELSVAREQAGRKRFYRVRGDDVHDAYFVKVFNLPAGTPRLRYFLRRSKAREERAVARSLDARGFRTARPIAVGEERSCGALVRSIAIVPGLPAVDLSERFDDASLARTERRRIVEEFGRLNRALHEAGVDQDDTAPNNFLIDREGRLALIDFERCRVGDRPLASKRRWTLLAKLHRYPVRVSATDRLAFLRAYLGDEDSRERRREVWNQIREAFLRIRRRDARRAAAAAFKAGRHLERHGGAWVVRARGSAPVVARELGPEQARRAWIRAHQLERLSLPALRPVRLKGGRIELMRPEGSGKAPDARAIQIARRKLERLGRLSDEPEWLADDTHVWLANPECFDPGLSPDAGL